MPQRSEKKSYKKNEMSLIAYVINEVIVITQRYVPLDEKGHLMDINMKN